VKFEREKSIELEVTMKINCERLTYQTQRIMLRVRFSRKLCSFVRKGIQSSNESLAKSGAVKQPTLATFLSWKKNRC